MLCFAAIFFLPCFGTIVFALDWLLVVDLLTLDLSSGPLLAHLFSSLKGSEWLRLNLKLFVGFIGRCVGAYNYL